MPNIAILGRQSGLSLAELESLYGPAAIEPLGQDAAAVDAEADFARLGGTIKLARQVEAMEKFTWPGLQAKLAALVSGHSGKLQLGLSFYGFPFAPRLIAAKGLELKKLLAGNGVPARLVPNREPALSSAQVIHNKLVDKGLELVVIKRGAGCLVGQTYQVQDIEAYGRRDYGRPERSAKIGMLPPKLAQIMINLASPRVGTTVLDPFCGTGVVLQEAALMGLATYGTDIEAELVDMSRRNLESQGLPTGRLESGDARTHWWADVQAVVTEGYLGPALTAPPNANEVAKLKKDAAGLTLSFLTNLHPQIPPRSPVVMTLPAWKQHGQYTRLGILDQITDLGYTLTRFKHASQNDLLYYREGQVVARELIVLRRN